jgi:hypothetical protein
MHEPLERANDRALAVNRGMENAKQRGVLRGWRRYTQHAPVWEPYWVPEPTSASVHLATPLLNLHDAELFLAGVAAALTSLPGQPPIAVADPDDRAPLADAPGHGR